MQHPSTPWSRKLPIFDFCGIYYYFMNLPHAAAD